MALTRNECGRMTDGALQVSIDGRRSRLRHDWDRGRPGALTDIFELALLLVESELRGYRVRGPLIADQLSFDEAVWGAVMQTPRPEL